MGDCFIKFDQISGEAEDKEFKGAIDVAGWRWGADWSGRGGAGAAGAPNSRGTPRAFTFTHVMDRSGPALMMRMLQNANPNAVLTMRRAGGQALTYLKISFQKVRLISIDIVHDAQRLVPEEVVTFSFESVDYDYIPQSAAGAAGGGASSMSWRATD